MVYQGELKMQSESRVNRTPVALTILSETLAHHAGAERQGLPDCHLSQVPINLRMDQKE